MGKPRVLVKFSGEALSGSQGFGIAADALDFFAQEVKSAHARGIELALVIGGGNLYRGSVLRQQGLDRVTGDHMGMLATVMNGLALRDAIERTGVPTRLLSAIPIDGMVGHYDQRRTMRYLSERDVVIFCAGTGNPFFTTDTAACLRAIEIKADVMFKATQVDGIYDRDPNRHPEATKYARLSYDEVLRKRLAIMDMTAISLARDHGLPLRVVRGNTAGFLLSAIDDQSIGTHVRA